MNLTYVPTTVVVAVVVDGFFVGIFLVFRPLRGLVVRFDDLGKSTPYAVMACIGPVFFAFFAALCRECNLHTEYSLFLAVARYSLWGGVYLARYV